MLLKIREKSQGVFAWIILIVICVPFALWGIQNYVGGASEDAVANVGDTEFFQNDVNRAYQQYSQKFAGMNVDETMVRQQALLKLIKDEVLLQRVQKEGLVIPDEDAKKFIQSLPSFQLNDKFNLEQYKLWLNSQGISSAQFISRIKQARVMEQYQRSVLASSFATQYDIDNFFKIQNQTRDIDYLTIAVTPVTDTPAEEAINEYYQKHQDSYQTVEQVSVEYISLSLDDLAKQVAVTDETLKVFYEDQKALYTTKERRKISHILFSFKKGDDSAILAKAQAAKKELANKSFEALAAEISDDTGTAKIGGDLGLFTVGGLEKALEDVASTLELGQVSEPVKSAFGYHLLKVTELVPAKTKSFEAAKVEVTKALQRKEAENNFYEMSEQLASVSYENPDNLAAAADAIGVKIEKSALFSKEKAGEGISQENAVRVAAFSEDVLAGNNSEAIELGSDKLVVLRMLEHKPASVRPLIEVNAEIITALLKEKAQQHAEKTAIELKNQLIAGKTIQEIATEKTLELKKFEGLTRDNGSVPLQVKQIVFTAAKPVDNKPTILTAVSKDNTQYVISINKVTEGVMSESDKKQLVLAQQNIAKALGEATFDAVLNSLQANADVVVKQANN